MSSILIKNIRQLFGAHPLSMQRLRGAELNQAAKVENAYLLIDNQRIVSFGAMTDCPERADTVLDATDRIVLPAWCDSHTHLVFAATREEEFEMRIRGSSYEEITASGGGILNSARKLQQMSEDELFERSLARLQEAQKLGTGCIEIKSGYGLTVDSELKMLRVIRRLKAVSDVEIKTSFLGAHAVPMAYKNNREEYISLIINDMLPQIAERGLADYVDVFCEKIAFSSDETDRILTAATQFGLKPKIHTNQFNSMGGIETAVKHQAISVDHLEVLNDNEIDILKNSDTIAALLPTAPFFLNDAHTPPARKLIDAGATVALATDFNPGTTPSVSMPFVVSLACIRLRMTPIEVLNAATLNGAAALELSSHFGSLATGKMGSCIITKPVPSLAYLPYAFGSNWIEQVILKGKIV
ncbi:MAG: imidazolonepropionase [Saprospiraceae bacterium]|nr:imidazolonepropionase [Saprospiraceae bacterium]